MASGVEGQKNGCGDSRAGTGMFTLGVEVVVYRIADDIDATSRVCGSLDRFVVRPSDLQTFKIVGQMDSQQCKTV